MAATIAFIGGGNMAASLIGGLLAAGRKATDIRVAEPVAVRAEWLRTTYGVTVGAGGSEIVEGAAAVVLAVKPQQLRAACQSLAPSVGTVVVSIAAGIRLASLRQWLGPELHYVRSMPNTPALLGAGITGLYAPPETPVPARQLAENILNTAGPCVWLESEAQMDAVTALSGSGPAYYFLLTEALREAGVGLGLAPDVAAQLARQTFIGAARMADGSEDVSQLRINVTSKGGTTEAAIAQLESAGLRTIFAEALGAAAARSKALGDQLSKDT